MLNSYFFNIFSYIFLFLFLLPQLSLCQLNRSDYGWGPTGHSLVADIAQLLLNESTQTNVLFYLPDVNGSLSAVSSWADHIKSDKSYAWSSILHFIDTPDWDCTYVEGRDCIGDGISGRCVDGAIKNYTKRLTMNDTLSFFQLNEALKFLVHFIGDVHQPLHVGFTTDRGGNSIKGHFEGKSENLHSVWDSGIMDKRLHDSFGNSYNSYLGYMMQQLSTTWRSSIDDWSYCSTPEPNLDCATQWATEAVKLACSYSYVLADGVTPVPHGFQLGDDYHNRNYPIVEEQLAKGGVRLANVLNRLFS